MLPLKNRLVKRQDYERVYRSGRFFAQEELSFKIAKNGLKESRIGIVVGLKFSSRAVARNQAKRKLREIFRLLLPKMERGWDVVVFAKKKNNIRGNSFGWEQKVASVMEKSGICPRN